MSYHPEIVLVLQACPSAQGDAPFTDRFLSCDGPTFRVTVTPITESKTASVKNSAVYVFKTLGPVLRS